jgi:hypothetical protein
MAGPGDFRKFAQVCVEMANDVASAEHRTWLLDMAITWRRLAEDAERFEQMLREVDETFDPPRPRERHPSRRTS